MDRFVADAVAFVVNVVGGAFKPMGREPLRFGRVNMVSPALCSTLMPAGVVGVALSADCKEFISVQPGICDL